MSLRSGGTATDSSNNQIPAEGGDPLGHVLRISFGRRATDSRPVIRELTFGDLITQFSAPELTRGELTSAEYHALDKEDPAQKKIRNREKDGSYFVPCIFKSGYRRNEDIEHFCGIALDFDDGNITAADIRQRLQGYSYAAYTTYSSLPRDERWRVFIPYANPTPAELHVPTFQHFQDLFRGAVDPHCATPCQFSYLPSCPADAARDFQFLYEIGAMFDPRGVVVKETSEGDADREPAPNADDDSDELALSKLQDALQLISADDRKTWVEFGLAIKRKFGDGGLSVWLGWSKRSAKFDLDEALKAWASFKDRGDGPKITIASIFYMARELGWKDDVSTAETPEHIAKINETFFVAQQSNKVLVFEERGSPIDGQPQLHGMSFADFRNLFLNQLVTVYRNGEPRAVSAAEAWLTHPQRRQYKGIVMAPNQDLAGYYNTWRGFGVVACKGSWRRMRKHLLNIVCRGDKTLFEYLLGWLAYAVQFPDRMAEVAIVLQGGRGTGKGTLARAIGKLFGAHFRHISQARHLVGNFNAHLAECILLFVDEAFWAGDKQGEATLKQLITEPSFIVERKRCDAESAPNRLHVIMASNSHWVVPAGLDERRYAVFELDDAKKQDSKYFKALNRELEDGGLAAMLYDLLQRDLSTFNIRNVPQTKALVHQKLLSMDPAERWWFEHLVKGKLPKSWSLVDLATNDWEKVSIRTLHDDYVKALQKTGVSRRSTATELGMRIRKFVPKGYPKRCLINEQNPDGYRVEVVDAYEFPPLAACRKHFESIANLDGFDWEAGDMGDGV